MFADTRIIARRSSRKHIMFFAYIFHFIPVHANLNIIFSLFLLSFVELEISEINDFYYWKLFLSRPWDLTVCIF